MPLLDVAARRTSFAKNPFPSIGTIRLLHLAHVVELHVLHERRNEMDARIDRAANRAGDLADAHACRAARHHDDAEPRQEEENADDDVSREETPSD